MFGDHASKHEALANLLASLFPSPRDLRYFVREVAPSLEDKVPIERVGAIDAARDATEALSGANEVHARLFDELVQRFERRELDIRAAQRKWQRIVLFLSANPPDLPSLEAREEVEGIRHALARAFKGDVAAGLVVRHGVTRADWRVHVEQLRPWVVHFSGHGDVWGRPIVAQGAGHADVPTGPILDQFTRVGVEGVFLAACHSDRLASAAVDHGPKWAVGMFDKVRDDVVIHFAAGFYEGIALGKTARESFDWASEVARWDALPRPKNPRFYESGGTEIAAVGARTERSAEGVQRAVTTVAAADLRRLLDSIFDDVVTLKTFLRSRASTVIVDREILATGSTAAIIADAADVITRRNMADTELYSRLAWAFPQHYEAVRALAEAHGCRVDPDLGWDPVLISQADAEARIRQVLAEGEPVVVRLITHANAHPGPKPTFKLEGLGGRTADPTIAERAIGTPLTTLGQALSAVRHGGTIELVPQCTPAASIRAGIALKRVTGLTVVVHQYNKEWVFPPEPSATVVPRLVELPAEQTAGREGAVLLSITQFVKPAYDRWTLGRAPVHAVELQPPGGPSQSCLRDADQARAWALQVGELVRRLRAHCDTVHIFAAVPGPLAVAVGRELNAVGRIQLWDLDRGVSEHYILAFDVRQT